MENEVGRDRSDFERELEELINKHSMESVSNTPDYVLAQYLDMCLTAYNVAIIKREKYYGGDKVIVPEPIS